MTDGEIEIGGLKLEIQTLRNLRAKSDAAFDQVIKHAEKAYEVEVAKLKAEHAEELDEKSVTIRNLRAALHEAQKANHGEELAEACKTINALERSLATSEQYRASMKGDLIAVMANHYGVESP